MRIRADEPIVGRREDPAKRFDEGVEPMIEAARTNARIQRSLV